MDVDRPHGNAESGMSSGGLICSIINRAGNSSWIASARSG